MCRFKSEDHVEKGKEDDMTSGRADLLEYVVVRVPEVRWIPSLLGVVGLQSHPFAQRKGSVIAGWYKAEAIRAGRVRQSWSAMILKG